MDRRGVVTRSWSALKLKFILAACAAALGALAVTAGTASATPGYAFAPPPFGSLSLTVGIAVDNSSSVSAGDVYVADLVAGTLDKFNAAGTEELGKVTGSGFSSGNGPWAVGVDSVTGDVYASVEDPAPGKVDKFDAEGHEIALPAGAFQVTTADSGVTAEMAEHYEPSGVAIDNSCFYKGLSGAACTSADPANGNVYVADRNIGVVYEFTPEGAYVSQFGKTKLEHPVTIAVDSNGAVYVANGNKNVKVFSEGKVTLFSEAEHESNAVTIDHSTGDIFVWESALDHVQQYSSTGEQLAVFGEGAAGHSYGIAVNESTHTVYVSDIDAGNVKKFEFGEPPPPPKVLPPATEVKGHSAELHGELNPGGATGKVEYHFDFYTEGTCAAQAGITGTTPTETVEEAKEKKVTAVATGLTPVKPYKYCLVSSNPFGSTLSENEDEFITTAAAPAIESESVVERTTVSLKIEAVINPGGAATTCEVQYGTTEAYGLTAPCSVAGTGTVGVPVTAELTGLSPNTTYHFRFVASNEIGGAEPPGSDVEVKTKPLVECETGEANPVGSETTTLHGTVKTGEEPGRYFFEYGTTTAYGSKTEVLEASGEGTHPVSISVTGLVPKTPYHYRIVCTPKNEPTLEIPGADATFETLPAKPAIIEEFSENESRHSVSLGAEINPKNSETTYVFEYGKTNAYGSKTSGGTIPAGVATVEAGPEAVTELEPGTTYHFRVVATNGAGTEFGPDETFTTTAPKLAIIESESSAQVTQTTATINGTINPNGLQTTYTLELGTDTNYGTPVFGEVGSGTEGVQLAFALTNLLPGTTYHFRFVAQNEDGTAFGADQTFTTGSFPPVIIPPAPVQIVPTPPQPTEPNPHIETRQEKYRHAVALCKKKPKKKRAACMRRAKKQFGPVKKKGKKKK